MVERTTREKLPSLPHLLPASSAQLPPKPCPIASLKHASPLRPHPGRNLPLTCRLRPDAQLTAAAIDAAGVAPIPWAGLHHPAMPRNVIRPPDGRWLTWADTKATDGSAEIPTKGSQQRGRGGTQDWPEAGVNPGLSPVSMANRTLDECLRLQVGRSYLRFSAGMEPHHERRAG